MHQPDLMSPVTQGAAQATFSPCRRYRYTLDRTWDPARPRLVFCMLNPSTADETVNDPTVERCQRRAVAGGFGAVAVVNLFALRSTDPQMLYQVEDPVGPDNDAAIVAACTAAPMVICAWGNHGQHRERAEHVIGMLRGLHVPLYALRVNQDGSPRHPLYVSNDTTPLPF